MTSLNCEDERETLVGCKRELQRQRWTLLAQKDALTRTTFDQRHEALLRQFHEIERRLADLYLDEQSMHRMEGGE